MKLIVTVALFEDDDAMRWQDSEFTARQEHVGSHTILGFSAERIGDTIGAQVRGLLSNYYSATHSESLEVAAE
jgi:hypothetical protein